MIQCPKCGADNMVGAIFCRSCHQKLNLDEIQPDDLTGPPEPAAKKIVQALQRVIVLVVVVALVALLGALFWPVKAGTPAMLGENEINTLNRKIQAMANARSPRRFVFDAEEATAAVNRALGLPATSGTVRPQSISIEFLGDDVVRVVYKASLFGKLPLVTQITGVPEANGPGNVSFLVSSATTGKLPLVGPLRANALAKLNALIQGNGDLSKIRSATRKIEFRGGQVGITVGGGAGGV